MLKRTILLVEDEALVALHTSTLLENAQWDVAGPIATVAEALAFVESRGGDLAGAILDINLGGDMSWPIARALQAKRIPFFFVSGYARANGTVPADLAGARLLSKPINEGQLSEALTSFAEPRPFPDRSLSRPRRTEITDELEVILEGIGEGFYSVDRDWRICRFNSEAAKHFRRPASEMIGRKLWEIFPAARDTGLGRMFVDTHARRVTVTGEIMSVIMGPRRLAYRLFPLGDGMGVVFRDVTDLRNAEQSRELLINELSHRVKNTLAMVLAIAGQTLKGADLAVRRDFEQRLLTLSSVHNLLTDENWGSAEINDVVQASLSPHLVDGKARIDFAGPPLRLKPKCAVAVSMALHELGTNALKYGALSTETGRVGLGWTTVDGRFRLVWKERDGPPVRPPSRTGFGARLIQQGLSAELSGEVNIDYHPGGVVCTIDSPLEAVREN
jgi:two-component sensor histidine kinase/DNA-binding NarL/FixJ family response regulator